MTYTTPEQWRHIKVARSGGVTELTLHTDDGPLVWNGRAHQEVADLWAWLAADEATRVVILTGTGDAFCDQITSPSSEREWHDIWLEGRRMIADLVNIDVPLISVVNGPATIHTELALLANIVLAVPGALFADHAHVTRGVVPGDGVQVVWRNLVGPSRASYHLLTGIPIAAEEALRLGMVHEIHEPGEVMARAHALAEPLAALPREMLAYTCAALRIEDRRHLPEAVAHGLGFTGLAVHIGR
ncbi:enoyl-CoA hydratase/isomerase family protein [Dactylosporangium salmoneum]|uniref:Enoyl-CoA hydratase/isomerase family protein n=1 Tax=Dactylosporangium salmoneum TaxID=53361 RepID=A0ABN3FXN5_9ACTN